jgi:hypothetical protein
MLNKLVLHRNYLQTIKEIQSFATPDPHQNIPTEQEIHFSDLIVQNAQLVPCEKMEKIKCLPYQIEDGVFKNRHIAAYDESFMNYACLEGIAYFTSHSMVLLGEQAYAPICYLTANFYTRSQTLNTKLKTIRVINNPEREFNKDYNIDKVEFLKKNVPDGVVLLIDGPIIGGDYYTFMTEAIEEFHKRDVIPIFFVKNSQSNLVTENIKDFVGKYNSDMHWAYNYLKPGERTSFFLYYDKYNDANSKVFCYLRAFNVGPQRIEIHSKTYDIYKDIMSDVINMVYYLILVQGDQHNPQVRPIAIAEKYAREILRMINVAKIMKASGLMPTMNQERFGYDG